MSLGGVDGGTAQSGGAVERIGSLESTEMGFWGSGEGVLEP